MRRCSVGLQADIARVRLKADATAGNSCREKVLEARGGAEVKQAEPVASPIPRNGLMCAEVGQQRKTGRVRQK
jgi:hypothetical protein